MNIFILFGITGDLAKKRVIPALVELEKRQAGSKAKKISQLAIGVGRKVQPPAEFFLLKKHAYICGELDSQKTYRNIKKELYARINAAKQGGPVNVIIYSSLPPQMHAGMATLFAKHAIDAKLNKKLGVQVRFLFEKPIGIDLQSAQHDMAAFHAALKADAKPGSQPLASMHFVDHYLFKESLDTLKASVTLQPELFEDLLGSPHITEIQSVMYETDDVKTRGSFYDAVGALNDVGQNHLLQMLAEGLRLRDFILHAKNEKAGVNAANSAKKTAKNVPKTKAEIMGSLKIVNNPIFGQYRGYAQTEGVKPTSKTETYFRVEALYKGEKNAEGASDEIKCIISSGKALGIKKSGLILIEGGAKDSAKAAKNKSASKKGAKNEGREIFIDMSLGKKDAYLTMFERIVAGDVEGFAKEQEIIAGWKFTKRAKQIKTRKNIVYESLHDIIEE